MAARYLSVCLVALTYFLLVAGSSFDDIDDAVDVVEQVRKKRNFLYPLNIVFSNYYFITNIDLPCWARDRY